MIGRIVATIRRAERRGTVYDFTVTHDPTLHAPYGLHRVYHHGREIGRQLSLPNLADCERMLAPADAPSVEQLKRGYTAATRARQAALRPDRLYLARHAGEPDDTTFVLHTP